MKSFARGRWTPLALGVLLGMGAALRAAPSEDGTGGGPGGGGREAPFEKIKAELGLSEEQAQKLKAHRQTHRQTMVALFQDARTKRQALRAELEKPNFDEGKVKSLQASAQAAGQKLQDHRLQGILEVKKILTPEQYAKFQSLMKERRERFLERRGVMGGGAGGGRFREGRGGGRFREGRTGAGGGGDEPPESPEESGEGL